MPYKMTAASVPLDSDTDPAVADVLQAFAELNVARQRLRGRDARQPGDLSFAQLRLLTALDEDEGCPAGQLAERAGVTPGTATGMIDTLEAMGVVTRERSDADRRVVRARLTPEGRQLRDAKRRATRRVFEEALATLDPADLAAAPRVLRVLASAMKSL